MSLPVVGEENYPTPDDVLNVILSSMEIDAERRGLTINVLPGSDHYNRAKAFAKRVSVAIANGKIARDNFNPLTAVGDALIDLCGLFGIFERVASKAAGYVIVTGTGTISIPAGHRCTSPSGEKYETTTAASVPSGSPVQIQSVSGGESTNIAAGTKLTWDSGSVGNLNRVCTVDSGDIDGGTDADDETTMRRRLIRKLSRPGVGGNAAQIEEWAEASSSAVDSAYVYTAVRGPGSYDIAVIAASGDRTLSSATTTTVASYVAGQMPGHANLNVTSGSKQEVDIVLAATLALPASAGGAGGGWRNSTPWPNANSGNVKITAFNTTTKVATTSAAALNGLAVGTQIGVWDQVTDSDEPVMREYTVDSVTLNGGFYDITVQGGFSFNPNGAYISTGAINLASYAQTALTKIRELGPGEKTTNVNILPLGWRKPTPEEGTETDLNSRLLTAIQNEHAEVRSLEYAARYDTGTTTTRTSPSVPTTTANAPRVLVLKHLAIRKA